MNALHIPHDNLIAKNELRTKIVFEELQPMNSNFWSSSLLDG